MPTAPCTIYAVQYYRRNTNSSELFVGDHHNTPMKMAYFVWALTNGTQTVVVDLGFTEEVGTRRGRRSCAALPRGLAMLDIDCTKGEHVILVIFIMTTWAVTLFFQMRPSISRMPR